MSGCLSIVIAVASLGLQSADAADRETTVSGEAQVVANRSSVPDAPRQPSAGAADGESEDRPLARGGGRAEHRSDGPGGAIAREAGRNVETGWLDRMRGLWPLAVVLALIGALVLLAKRLLPGQWRGRATGRGMVEVLGRHHLSAKQSVAVLKVGRRIVLVGMTPDRLSHLDTIADPDEVAELVGRSAVAKGGSLTNAFEREVLREAAAYEAPPGVSGADAGGSEADRAAGYAAARQQLRGLLSRVRSMAGSA